MTVNYRDKKWIWNNDASGEKHDQLYSWCAVPDIFGSNTAPNGDLHDFTNPKIVFFRRETTWITQANSYFVACTAFNTGYVTENTMFRNFCSSATGAFDM